MDECDGRHTLAGAVSGRRHRCRALGAFLLRRRGMLLAFPDRRPTAGFSDEMSATEAQHTAIWVAGLPLPLALIGAPGAIRFTRDARPVRVPAGAA